METVLVAGGTGALGAPVVQRLAGNGHHVRVLTRRGRSGGELVSYMPGDLTDVGSLCRALEGCTAVHISVRGGPTPTQYDQVEARGTAQLAELAAQAGVRRLTYLSHMLADETSSAPDLRAKGRAEAAIMASGVPYTIFRPTLFMDTLPRQIRGRRAVVLGRQNQPYHFLAAADLANMVVRALSTPEAEHRHFWVHGPEPLTIAEALTIYCARQAPGTRVSTMPLWFMAGLDRTVLRGQLRGPLGLMRVLSQTGEQGDPTPANVVLGAPKTTLAQWCDRQ